MKILALLTCVVSLNFAFGQKYLTRNGYIKFYSEAPIENIEAVNNEVNSALDIKTGDFVFKVNMKKFEFEKSLMQEHFNENYVESDKFPYSIFTGKIKNINSIDFSKNGSNLIEVQGDLTIHGKTKKISQKGTLEISNNVITGNAVFMISLDDYKIKIPKVLFYNIAETIEITVNVKLSKFENQD